MKTIYVLMSVAILALFLSVAGFMHANAPGHPTSFSITVTSTAIITKVTYDPDQAPQVEKYIDSSLAPELVFGDKHEVDKEVQISGSELKYHIEGSPGKLNMTADKKSNADSSLNKLKNIFEGLKSVIKPT
jgi:formylmethanofuran dehydrogenase subunit A